MYLATIIFFGPEGVRETVTSAHTEEEIQKKIKLAKEIIKKHHFSFLASVIEEELDEDGPKVLNFVSEGPWLT